MVVKELEYDKCIIRKRFAEFYFKNNDAIVKMNRDTYVISCTCYHGSTIGINNTNQICYHKKFILSMFGLDKDKFINKKNR